MSWITGLAVYFVIWWITLFAVLPFGVRRDETVVRGNDPGAPAKARVFLKIVINTLVAFVVWLIFYVVYRYELIAIR